MIIREHHCRVRPCWAAVCVLGRCSITPPFSPFHKTKTLLHSLYHGNEVLVKHYFLTKPQVSKTEWKNYIKFSRGHSPAYCIQFWTSSYRQGIDKLKRAQQRGTKMVRSSGSVRKEGAGLVQCAEMTASAWPTSSLPQGGNQEGSSQRCMTGIR